MTAQKSARIASSILVAVVVFQAAVVAGAPLGRYTQGGQINGSLPTQGRILALFSIALLLVMAANIQALVNNGPMRKLAPGVVRRFAWLTVAYSALGTVLNLASRSEVERPWAVVTIASLYFTYRTLQLTKPTD